MSVASPTDAVGLYVFARFSRARSAPVLRRAEATRVSSLIRLFIVRWVRARNPRTTSSQTDWCVSPEFFKIHQEVPRGTEGEVQNLGTGLHTTGHQVSRQLNCRSEGVVCRQLTQDVQHTVERDTGERPPLAVGPAETNLGTEVLRPSR